MNETRFLFVLDMIVLNLQNEGRRTYTLYRICVLSLSILLALRSTCFSYKTVTEDCLKPVILLLKTPMLFSNYFWHEFVMVDFVISHKLLQLSTDVRSLNEHLQKCLLIVINIQSLKVDSSRLKWSVCHQYACIPLYCIVFSL